MSVGCDSQKLSALHNMFDWYFRSTLREHRAPRTTSAQGKNWQANKFNYKTESDEPLFATLDCCMTNTNTTTDDLTQMKLILTICINASVK